MAIRVNAVPASWVHARRYYRSQNEDEANDLIAPFATVQFSIKTSGGHSTDSFNDQKEIERFPDRIKQL
ncbi:uncharacterized protein N7484_002176 [Penicillium longicatenatum]|uniref:uncharacterized protein n=1 Tax=Penicillium longicatenatum TaxID=1561947 RepID=UPI0025492978|nr:uncharacterized protein N7484_002176 [Penicillium longicatenatum]KAJ5658527.1 hypothetical protein N7484_002176 [Penicillium longicatenatum]